MSEPSTTGERPAEPRTLWWLPVGLAALAVLAVGLGALWRPDVKRSDLAADEEPLEIVSVAPAAPRPGGSLRVQVAGDRTDEPLGLVLGGRPIPVLARVGDALFGVVPPDTELGHKKLRVTAAGERSKPVHLDLATPLQTWPLSNILGALALVLFGVSSLRQGLERSLSVAAAQRLSRAVEKPTSAAVTGLVLGVLLGNEPLFGAGFLLALAALGLGSAFSHGVALLAFWVASRFALGPTHLSAVAGVWLLLGLYYATSEGRRRLKSAGLVVLGVGALGLGVHLLRSFPGSGLVWLDESVWAAFSGTGEDFRDVLSVFVRSALFALSEQHLRSIEGVLTAAAAQDAVHGGSHVLPLGLVLTAWLGSNLGSMLALALAMLGPLVMRRAACLALGVVLLASLIVVALAPFVTVAIQAPTATLTAVATGLSALLFCGLVLATRPLLRRLRRPVAAVAATPLAATAPELERGLAQLGTALQQLCLAVRNTDRDAVDRGVAAIQRSGERLTRAAGLAAADQRLSMATSHALGMQQGLVTASGLVERWLDQHVLESADRRKAELPASALRAVEQVERHLSEGIEQLRRAVSAGCELSLEAALEREIWIHASSRPEPAFAGPVAPFLLAFLQSLALVGHELYLVSELFGDDPVAPGRLALGA